MGIEELKPELTPWQQKFATFLTPNALKGTRVQSAAVNKMYLKMQQDASELRLSETLEASKFVSSKQSQRYSSLLVPRKKSSIVLSKDNKKSLIGKVVDERSDYKERHFKTSLNSDSKTDEQKEGAEKLKVEHGFATKFRTSFKEPSKLLQKYMTHHNTNHLSTTNLQKYKSNSQLKKQPVLQKPEEKKEQFSQNNHFSENSVSNNSSQKNSDSFQSHQFQIDDAKFKENQEDQEKLQLLEQRYMPRKYSAIEIRAPVPTLNQKQFIVKDTIRNALLAFFMKRKFKKCASLPQLFQEGYEQVERPIHLIALEKNRKNLLDILTNENKKSIRLQLDEDKINKFKKDTFNEVKDQYFKELNQKRDKKQKKVILSRKSCDQAAFEMRFLKKKQQKKLQNKLRWYIVNNINTNYDKDNFNYHKDIDEYLKHNYALKP